MHASYDIAGSNPAVSILTLREAKCLSRRDTVTAVDTDSTMEYCRPYGINHVRFVMGLLNIAPSGQFIMIWLIVIFHPMTIGKKDT